MTQTDFRFGFRTVGEVHNERRLVAANAAFVAHCHCDSQAKVEGDCYLSAFQFGADFASQLKAIGTTKGYVGATWSPWLWIDVDRDNIEAATIDARRIASSIVDRFAVDGDELLLFFSGRKGFHIGVPTSLWMAEPAGKFHAHCRAFAEAIALRAEVAIDVGVYDRVRAFRAPNSKHGKTGRFKRWLSFDELMHLQCSRIIELAAEPFAFDVPALPSQCDQATKDWQDSIALVDALPSSSRRSEYKADGSALNRSTLDFIRDGATNGDRARSLFSAAANLAEFGCSSSLAWALLSESALDSGLTLTEVRRQIECGLKHKGISNG